MREPRIAAARDFFDLPRGDLVGHTPAAEIGAALDPGIGCQDRVIVETGDRGIADSLGISSMEPILTFVKVLFQWSANR